MFGQRLPTLRALCGSGDPCRDPGLRLCSALTAAPRSPMCPLSPLLTVEQPPGRCRFWRMSLVEPRVSCPNPLKPRQESSLQKVEGSRAEVSSVRRGLLVLRPMAGCEKAAVFHPVHSFNRLVDGVFFWAGLSGPDEIDAMALH